MEMNEVTLESERLWLRWLREADFDQYARMCRDPEVMRFLGGEVTTDIDVWRQMASIMGHWYFRGHGIWAVEEKSTGNLIGRIGRRKVNNCFCSAPEKREGWGVKAIHKITRNEIGASVRLD